ncbi:MAG: hypothetical protein II106_06335, partial [Oscillospiraceae bacterium]|nr:hypothetical protein [Oscillospiraceae bacterium]
MIVFIIITVIASLCKRFSRKMPQMLCCAAGSDPGAFRLFLPKTIDNQKKHRYTEIIKQKREGARRDEGIYLLPAPQALV